MWTCLKCERNHFDDGLNICYHCGADRRRYKHPTGKNKKSDNELRKYRYNIGKTLIIVGVMFFLRILWSIIYPDYSRGVMFARELIVFLKIPALIVFFSVIFIGTYIVKKEIGNRAVFIKSRDVWIVGLGQITVAGSTVLVLGLMLWRIFFK